MKTNHSILDTTLRFYRTQRQKSFRLGTSSNSFKERKLIKNKNSVQLVNTCYKNFVTLYFALTNGVLMYGMDRRYEEMLRRIYAAERLQPRADETKPEV